MTMLNTGYAVGCDSPDCPRTGPHASNPGQARTRASGVGFTVKKYPSTEAYCPDHKPVD